LANRIPEMPGKFACRIPGVTNAGKRASQKVHANASLGEAGESGDVDSGVNFSVNSNK